MPERAPAFAAPTSIALIALMSAPAMKARSPAPVRTTALTSLSSRNPANRSRNSVSVATSSAFIASGRYGDECDRASPRDVDAHALESILRLR